MFYYIVPKNRREFVWLSVEFTTFILYLGSHVIEEFDGRVVFKMGAISAQLVVTQSDVLGVIVVHHEETTAVE